MSELELTLEATETQQAVETAATEIADIKTSNAEARTTQRIDRQENNIKTAEYADAGASDPSSSRAHSDIELPVLQLEPENLEGMDTTPTPVRTRQ